MNEMVAAYKSGRGKIVESPTMSQLLGKLDLTSPTSGCMAVGGEFKKMAAFSAFDTIALSSSRNGGGVSLNFAASGTDGAKSRSSVESLKQIVADQSRQVRRCEPVMPSLKLVREALASVKIETSGSSASLTAAVQESPGDSFVLPLMLIYGVPQKHPEMVPRDP